MRLEFTNTKGIFEDYPNKKRPVGRPRKKLLQKNIESLIAKNERIDYTLTNVEYSAFNMYDAFTIEWIVPVKNSEVENHIKEFIKAWRDILKNKARKYPALDLSGVRFIVPRDSYNGTTLVEYRVICTTFESALFIYSHLAAHYYGNLGYTGLAFHLYGTDETRKVQNRGGSFDLETGGRWSSFYYESTNDRWIIPAVDYQDKADANTIARVTAAAFRNYKPTHISCHDIAIVKGAVKFCEKLTERGVCNPGWKNVYRGFRSEQNFGLLYNIRTRRIECHRREIAWYNWNW